MLQPWDRCKGYGWVPGDSPLVGMWEEHSKLTLPQGQTHFWVPIVGAVFWSTVNSLMSWESWWFLTTWIPIGFQTSHAPNSFLTPGNPLTHRGLLLPWPLGWSSWPCSRPLAALQSSPSGLKSQSLTPAWLSPCCKQAQLISLILLSPMPYFEIMSDSLHLSWAMFTDGRLKKVIFPNSKLVTYIKTRDKLDWKISLLGFVFCYKDGFRVIYKIKISSHGWVTEWIMIYLY